MFALSATTLDGDGERIPDMELAQKKFLLTLPEYKNDNDLKQQFLDLIRAKNMAPWYEIIREELGLELDEDLLAEMRSNNEEVLKGLDESIETARKVAGATEVRDAILKKAEYLIKIGDKTNSVLALTQGYDMTIAVGYKIDNIFTCIRIGYFFMDFDLITRNLERAGELALMGIDYDRRNRLRIYKGVFDLAVRDFKSASNNFLSVINTFNCLELMDYSTFIRYTVYSALITLPRAELKEKVINTPDVLEVLHQAPDVREYLFSLYQCEYANFFTSLAEVEHIFRKDFILNPHYRFYVREMRILAYSQLLVSYKSLTLSYMAEQFGVTSEFIENELSRFIAGGRIFGKIDKVKGIIIVNKDQREIRNEMFKVVIRQGDVLLNRIQNLARFLDKKV